MYIVKYGEFFQRTRTRKKRETNTERQLDSHTDRKTDRHIDRETKMEMERQRDDLGSKDGREE